MTAGTRVVQRWRNDPFRPLDFRWQDAVRVVAGQRARWADRGDPIVKALVRYQRSLDPAATIRVRRQERKQFAAIRGAHELSLRNGLQRREVESRVLANQPPEEIAARCGLPLETVSWYESAFFECRSRLNAWGWIAARLFGARLWHGFANDDLGRIWAAAGYFGGPLVLDTVIAATRDCCRPGRLPTVSTCLEPGSGVPLSVQALLATMMIGRQHTMAWESSAFQLQFLQLRSLRCPGARHEAADNLARQVVDLARGLLTGTFVPQEARLKADRPQEPAGKRQPFVASLQGRVVAAPAASPRQPVA